MSYHVVLTGATGMIGKGVLMECLENEAIGKVTLVGRTNVGVTHPKIAEVPIQDLTTIDQVRDAIGKVDACFHCMGVSVVGLNEEVYTRLTFGVTKAIADTMYSLNPDMLFIYVSGDSTDSTEKGSAMWARVKGRAENYVLKKGFKRAVMFRPGVIIPEKGIRSRTALYNLFYTITRPFFPLLRRSKNITTTTRIGKAMIHLLLAGAVPPYVRNPEINVLAAEA